MIDVLRGQRSERVLSNGHDRLSTFGIGAELDAPGWQQVLRQLVARGLLNVAHERFGVLELTEAAKPVLRGEEPVSLRRMAPARAGARRSRRTAEAGSDAGAAAARAARHDLADEDARVFERLRAWRAEVARAHGLPSYVIFHDATLTEIARRRPADLAELGRVPGVGATKLERYGADVLSRVAPVR